MDEKQRTELALFRFSLIAPIVNGSLEGSVQEYLETTCAKTYDVPGHGRRQFSPRTLLCSTAPLYSMQVYIAMLAYTPGEP